jgi:hypothetical protein
MLLPLLHGASGCLSCTHSNTAQNNYNGSGLPAEAEEGLPALAGPAGR